MLPHGTPWQQQGDREPKEKQKTPQRLETRLKTRQLQHVHISFRQLSRSLEPHIDPNCSVPTKQCVSQWLFSQDPLSPCMSTKLEVWPRVLEVLISDCSSLVHSLVPEIVVREGQSGSLAVTVHQQLWMSIRVSLLPKLCLNFLHHKQRERQ